MSGAATPPSVPPLKDNATARPRLVAGSDSTAVRNPPGNVTPSPRPSSNGAPIRATTSRSGSLSLTTAMAQVERGANRIYGIQRDRPAISKYARGFVLALVAGLPALLGFLLLVGGGAVGEALAATYHWGGDLHTWWSVLRWPVGLLLTWASYTILLAHAPNRRQPTRPWLAAGGLIAIVLWTAVTLLLALYAGRAGAFRSTYGPLTSVFALLLWAYLTAVALLFGVAFCAQIEAVRAGDSAPTMTEEHLCSTGRASREAVAVASGGPPPAAR